MPYLPRPASACGRCRSSITPCGPGPDHQPAQLMTILRMDNVGIVVDDLDAAIAFFTELGMEREGEARIEGLWADRTVGLAGIRSDLALMRTPDGHSKLELTKY